MISWGRILYGAVLSTVFAAALILGIALRRVTAGRVVSLAAICASAAFFVDIYLY